MNWMVINQKLVVYNSNTFCWIACFEWLLDTVEQDSGRLLRLRRLVLLRLFQNTLAAFYAFIVFSLVKINAAIRQGSDYTLDDPGMMRFQ